MAPTSETILCLSHLRWDFVYQRPQHLLVRCARDHRVVYVEEQIFDASEPELELRAEDSITVAIPHLRAGTGPELAELAQRRSRVRRLPWRARRPVSSALGSARGVLLPPWSDAPGRYREARIVGCAPHTGSVR